LFTIGEFSKITGLTVKTLRFYHEQGLLVPTCVDDQSGYRYYNESKIERAAVISFLRRLEFTVAEINGLLEEEQDDAELLRALERQRELIEGRMRRLRELRTSLDQFIAKERKAREAMAVNVNQIEEKSLEPMLIAGVRMRGKYSDCGNGFSQIGRRYGRTICGPCFLLHYDSEYRENDANFEVCMPIRDGASRDGIDVRELPGGRCVSLVHQGPYDELGRAYAKIFKYVHEKSYTLVCPTREVYLKGPGMIFKGNPKKYLTEIQVLVNHDES
jgi:DNA-binding transcriptional MerR regulator